MIIVPVESCSFNYAKIRWGWEVVIERNSGVRISEIKALASACTGDMVTTAGTLDLIIGVEAKARG